MRASRALRGTRGGEGLACAARKRCRHRPLPRRTKPEARHKVRKTSARWRGRCRLPEPRTARRARPGVGVREKKPPADRAPAFAVSGSGVPRQAACRDPRGAHVDRLMLRRRHRHGLEATLWPLTGMLTPLRKTRAISRKLSWPHIWLASGQLFGFMQYRLNTSPIWVMNIPFFSSIWLDCFALGTAGGVARPHYM